ncbi:hypothetical protein CTI12_AA540480 [Artemisia annua]|uniref:Uncharacterized protein n=1 Tax=Artemisia annua TaxID=35608 RepID=A0A2U1L1Q0_ARTAN|nr:hypothetical protein CTI12_AA540480 [Artemisia annua]
MGREMGERWPSEWNDRIPALLMINPPTLIEDVDDELVCRVPNGEFRPFTISLVWDSIRDSANLVACKARKRVNARKWSFLLPILKYWRSQEGTPTNKELGEGSSVAASRILPVTGEPIHCTIPLLAARLVRHEDRLDAIASLVNNIPNEQVEVMSCEIEQLVMGHLEMGTMIEKLSAQFGEAMEFIGLLCTASTTTRNIMCDIDQALDTTRAQVMSLRRAQQEAQARERDRDQTIETMATTIQELQRRLDDNHGKP